MSLTTLRKKNYEKCMYIGDTLRELQKDLKKTLNPLEKLDIISKLVIGIDILHNESNKFFNVALDEIQQTEKNYFSTNRDNVE